MNIFLKMLLGPMAGAYEEGNGAEAPQRKHVQPKAPKGTAASRLIISLAITLVFGAVYYFFQLPALNFHTSDLYIFIILLCLVYTVCMIFLGGFRADTPDAYINYSRKKLAVPFWIIIAVAVVAAIGWLIGCVVFRAGAYSKLISVETGDFAEEVSEINWNQIPMLDEASSNNLANRKLGELSDLVSQFTVSESSAQINYKGSPVRVTYLNYGSIFKWWNNKSEGIPAYMTIDMRTQEVSVVRLKEGIKYSPSEYLLRDLNRHLRFNYPTLIFDEVNFEIDENGTPYWIASVVDKTIGLFGGTDVIGTVLVNAVTGDCRYYEINDIPSWVDRVFSANLLVSQYNYYGKYHNGFFNSLFGQSDCTATTQGYNYIAQDDDVWMYTGITSVTGDRGNIGFILVNQRTKEAHYYSCAGAEEYSAMSSAEGAVQQYQYEATFPLLLNISDQPSYFMALKDSAGLVKMYAMVNVQQYQIVATGNSLSECQENYHNLLVKNSIIDEEYLGDGSTGEDTAGTESDAAQETDNSGSDNATEVQTETVTGTIADIRSANIDGNTIFYLQLDGEDVYYTISAKDYPVTAIFNVGDTITVTYVPQTGENGLLTEAVSVKLD